jgi:hypothetical protein
MVFLTVALCELDDKRNRGLKNVWFKNLAWLGIMEVMHKYRAAESGNFVAKFENADEVETVHKSFKRYLEQLQLAKSELTPEPYHRKIAEGWSGDIQEYRYGDTTELLFALKHYGNTIDQDVKQVLDNPINPNRLCEAGRRYELGALALDMAAKIEVDEHLYNQHPGPMGC